MRRAGLFLLALVSFGTFGSSLRAQEPATAPSVAPAPAPPPPTTPAAPAPSASTPAPATEATPPTPASRDSVSLAGENLPESGYHLDVGVGFSLPTGSLNGAVLGALPLIANAGRRFGRQLILGISGTAAVAFPAGTSGYDFIIGGGGEYYLAGKLFGLWPWIGGNFGFEAGGGSGIPSQSGWLGTVAAGADYLKGFAPFAAFSVGSFGSGDTHEYITLGMRGVYDW